MKKLLLIIACLCACGSAKAEPYFRLLDLAKPKITAGAFVDPVNPENSAVGSMLAIATHSTADGCALPTIVCEDWTPLAVGFSANSGKALLAVGPSVNLAPLTKSLLLKAIGRVEGYDGVKSALGSERLDRKDLSVSFGPNLVLSPTEKWKGYFRVFAGASWAF